MKTEWFLHPLEKKRACELQGLGDQVWALEQQCWPVIKRDSQTQHTKAVL